jgi:hypothetical protein
MSLYPGKGNKIIRKENQLYMNVPIIKKNFDFDECDALAARGAATR